MVQNSRRKSLSGAKTASCTPVSHITIGDSEIVPLSPVKNLGAWFDETLLMNSHIINITKATSAAFYHLYNLRGIRKYLTKITTEILIHAFISSRLDYCNSLLYGLPEIQIKKLTKSTECGSQASLSGATI